MDRGVSDADWVSRGTSYILLWLSLILARSLTCNTLFSDSCVDTPVLCSLSVLSCFVTLSYQLVGLSPAAAKCFCTTNCIRSTSRELLSQWRPQLRALVVDYDVLIVCCRSSDETMYVNLSLKP